jgi:CheY-like chemotaxis protein
MGETRVALVGHCGPDAYALRAAVRSALPGSDVQMISDASALEAYLEGADVLLVNRVLDGDFEDASGIDLIRRLAAKPDTSRPSVMLISNFPEAQAEAAQAGAMPGFGKKQMYSAEMRKHLEAAIAARRAARE